MNKWLKYGVLASTLFLFSCQEFLEPKSQSEYVPKLVKSLEESRIWGLEMDRLFPFWACLTMM